VAGPFTGGQYAAQDPLHFDVVAVSGTKEYSVNPLALVSTVAPPIVAVFRAVPDELAEAEVAPAAGVLLELAEPGVDELPHAAVIRAVAVSPAAAHNALRIAVSVRNGT
jgi:hypothetical protein